MHEQLDLLSSIGVCLSVAAVLALVAQKLRQPLILAYLLAGVVIGPEFGMGWIANSERIHDVAEIGLILLLFLIGMELDLKKLVAAGRPVILAGLFQFPLCAAIGLGLFMMLGYRMRADDYGLLYLPVCLALSSTMIVVKLLYDKGEMDTLAGRITLSVLVFQDVWAIVVLAIQPNLLNPHITPLLASLGKSVLLVAVTLAASRWVLPAMFRSVAKQPEVMLVVSLAWCFAVCAGASQAGLSREMGALIAGVSLSAFPYNLDVIAKVVSIRDFFVTLFFVALGMQIPFPTIGVLGMAIVASGFLVASRFVTVFPLLHASRLGFRTSLLPAINLSQISEFSLVIASLGVAHAHIPNQIVSVLIFVFAITAVASTYLIDYNDKLARWLTGQLKRSGYGDINTACDQPDATSDSRDHDVVMLGFYHQASAMIHEWERAGSNGKRHPFLDRLLIIDFNPQVHAELKRRNIACIYGDLANMDTLHHAHIDRARLILMTVPDSVMRGTSNRRLMQQARRLNPEAKVVATADRVRQALELYAEGAEFVFMTHLHAAKQRAQIVEEGLRIGFDALRGNHLAELKTRNDVLS